MKNHSARAKSGSDNMRSRSTFGRRHFTALSFAAAAVSLWQSPVQAQTLDHDYWITAQAYFPKIDTDVRVTSKDAAQIGTDIDLENDLALDNDQVLPEVTVGARFGKVIAGFDYFRIRRSGTVGLARDITFDDVTYPASVEVASRYDTDIYRLTVGYAFVQNENLELGGAIGLHATTFDLSIRGDASVGNQSVGSELRRRKFLAPLPTLGLFGTYKIAPRVDLNGRVDYLSLDIGEYDGRLINAQAGVTYRFVENVGIGAAYRLVDYRVGVDKNRWEGRTRYKLHGPALILQASF